jgi:hypothetical protein
MLSMINPDQLSRYEQASRFQGGEYHQQMAKTSATGFHQEGNTFPDATAGRG